MKDWLDRTYGIDCDVYALCEFINIDVMWILDALEKQVSFYESLIGCEDEDTDEEEDK